VCFLGLSGGGGDGTNDCDARSAACRHANTEQQHTHMSRPAACRPAAVCPCPWSFPFRRTPHAIPSHCVSTAQHSTATAQQQHSTRHQAPPPAHLPVSEPCSSRVSLESRKGMCTALPSLSLCMTVPRVSRLLLMKLPSMRWLRFTSACRGRGHRCQPAGEHQPAHSIKAPRARGLAALGAWRGWSQAAARQRGAAAL
jgi:hypothetical protein